MTARQARILELEAELRQLRLEEAREEMERLQRQKPRRRRKKREKPPPDPHAFARQLRPMLESIVPRSWADMWSYQAGDPGWLTAYQAGQIVQEQCRCDSETAGAAVAAAAPELFGEYWDELPLTSEEQAWLKDAFADVWQDALAWERASGEGMPEPW